MAERLSEVEAHLDNVRQLSSVIAAMRGIAAARSREAGQRLASIRAYADTIARAIGEALLHLPGNGAASDPAPGTPDAPDAPGPHGTRAIIIALCSEQGFVGGYNGTVLDRAAALLANEAAGRAQLLLVGTRGLVAASERGLVADWSVPMASHVEEVTALANRLADTLFDRMADGPVARVAIVHARPSPSAATDIVEEMLIPFDYARFPKMRVGNKGGGNPPILQLPPAMLLARLADEYVFAQLCEALTLSFAAENEARMRAMVAARDNVGRKQDELTATARRLRQEQITEEVIELAAGVRA